MRNSASIFLILGFALFCKVANAQRSAADSLGLDSLWGGFLSPITIRPDVPDTIFGDTALNVCDFVISGNEIFLLTYQKEERWKRQEDAKKTLYKGAQLLLLRDDSIVYRVPIPDLVIQLENHPVFGLFVEGLNTYFRIDTQHGLVAEVLSKNQFREEVEPIIDSCRGFSLISTYSDMLPFMDYYVYNHYTQAQAAMVHIDDKLGRELFMSEYKYLHPKDKVVAMNYEIQTGVKKEIAAAFINGFQYSNYFEKLNVPAFLDVYSWVVFDHPNAMIHKYSLDGDLLDEKEMKYLAPLKGLKWSEKIIYDATERNFFSYWNKAGKTIVAQIDLNTGTTVGSKTLYYDYCEQIQVVNGDVYYIYRPFESSQKRFLYKESIFAKP